MAENDNKEKHITPNEIVLKLTYGEVNTLINALSEMSFKEVYTLIGKIHAQSNSQFPKEID